MFLPILILKRIYSLSSYIWLSFSSSRLIVYTMQGWIQDFWKDFLKGGVHYRSTSKKRAGPGQVPTFGPMSKSLQRGQKRGGTGPPGPPAPDPPMQCGTLSFGPGRFWFSTRTRVLLVSSQAHIQTTLFACSTARITNLYINTGRWYLWHVPSTFATVNTHANVFFVFLPGGISKEWRHIVSANCDFDRQPLPMSL